MWPADKEIEPPRSLTSFPLEREHFLSQGERMAGMATAVLVVCNGLALAAVRCRRGRRIQEHGRDAGHRRASVVCDAAGCRAAWFESNAVRGGYPLLRGGRCVL